MINQLILTGQPALAGEQIRISQHSIQRYQERVDASSSVAVAVGPSARSLSLVRRGPDRATGRPAASIPGCAGSTRLTVLTYAWC